MVHLLVFADFCEKRKDLERVFLNMRSDCCWTYEIVFSLKNQDNRFLEMDAHTRLEARIAHMHTSTHNHMHTLTNKHININTHTHTYTHMHTHTQSLVSPHTH